MTDLLPGDRMIFISDRLGHYPWRGDEVVIKHSMDVRAPDGDKLYLIETSDNCHPLVFGSELLPFHPPTVRLRRDSPPDDDPATRRRRDRERVNTCHLKEPSPKSDRRCYVLTYAAISE